MLKKKKEMLPLVLGGLGPLQGLPDSGGTPGHPASPGGWQRLLPAYWCRGLSAPLIIPSLVQQLSSLCQALCWVPGAHALNLTGLCF